MKNKDKAVELSKSFKHNVKNRHTIKLVEYVDGVAMEERNLFKTE